MLSIIKTPKAPSTRICNISLSPRSPRSLSLHHTLIGRRLPSSTLLRTRGTDIRIRITRHDQTRINRFGHVRELET